MIGISKGLDLRHDFIHSALVGQNVSIKELWDGGGGTWVACKGDKVNNREGERSKEQ